MIRLAFIAALLAASLCACGQKGPLKLPAPAPAAPEKPASP
jgi:predicted small lipoprotein YifL